MENIQLIYLDLRQPIIFTKSQEKAQINAMENEESLLCYKINPYQGCSIEPLKEQLLEELVYSGVKNLETQTELSNEAVLLPIGRYLFVQKRAEAALNQEEWLNLAIEQQKDGLWERNKLKNLLYIRFLYEDNAFVTQILRPLEI